MAASSSKKLPSPLSGTLLLASPAMRDATFARSVIFMAAHHRKNGAFGYILNRPIEQRVADLLPGQNIGSLGDVRVYVGGPVSTDKLAFAALHWNKKKGTLRCQTHLSVPDAIEALEQGQDVRGFIGYSGWTGGQLENEIQHRSWIITAPKPVVLTTEEPTDMWGAVLKEMGPLYSLMAETPDNVGLN
jgi:putative transcriptional regulator